MPDVRLSPSGPFIPVELETDAVSNESVVPGANVTEALDYLFTANQFSLFDEFLGGTGGTLVASTDGTIGELSWSFVTTGGSLSRPATGDYIGAYQCSANASQISGIRPGPNGGGSSATFPLTVVTFIYWNVQANLSGVAGGVSRFGVGSNVEASQFGADGMYFEHTLGNVNWRVVGRRASINTTIVTTIPVDTTRLTELVFSRDPSTGSWNAFIDGALAGTLTSVQVPTQRQNGMMQTQASAGGVIDSVVDTFRLNYDR